MNSLLCLLLAVTPAEEIAPASVKTETAVPTPTSSLSDDRITVTPGRGLTAEELEGTNAAPPVRGRARRARCLALKGR